MINIQIRLRSYYGAELLISVESCHGCFFGHWWLAPVTGHLGFVKFHLVQLIFRLFIDGGELLIGRSAHLNMLARIVDRVHGKGLVFTSVPLNPLFVDGVRV